jgi:hypothetical protein
MEKMKKSFIAFGLAFVLFFCISFNAFCETRTYAQDIYPKIDLSVQKEKPLRISFYSSGSMDIIWFAVQNQDAFKCELKKRKFPLLGNYLEVTPVIDNASTILFVMQKGGSPCIISIKGTNDPVSYDYASIDAGIDIDTDEWKNKRENEKKDEFADPPFTIEDGIYSANQGITDTAPIVVQMGKTTKIIFEAPINFFAVPSPNRLKANISSADPNTLEISPLESDTEASFFVYAGNNCFYLQTDETKEYKYFDSYNIKGGYPYDSADDSSPSTENKDKQVKNLFDLLFK